MIEIGTLLQNRYLIKKQIGAGGMGAVYLAVDERFGNHVALKETFYKDQEFDAAFEREARLLNGLHHSVLPHVSDYFTENGEYFLVMQYIEGEDLFAALKSGKRFALETVLRWTDELLDALDYLHSQNPPIIHRDIKPQNLKITTRDNIVLLDFGLAKLNSEDSTAQSVFGYSRRYSSLEQIQGIGTDARSDIFSLAATVYHLLTNEPPIDALARAAAIVAGQPDPLKKADEINNEIPAIVANILKKGLALNSAERFESAQSMRDALKNSSAAETEEKQIDEAARVSDDSEQETSARNNFPALAAFAAGNKEAAPPEKADTESFAPVISDDKQLLSAVPENDLTDVQTRVLPASPRKSRVPFAAVAGFVLLLCVGLAAVYLINKSKSPTQTTGNQITETQTANPTTEVTETNSAPPVTNAPEQMISVSTTQDSETQNPEIKKETARTEKPEKTTATVKKESSRQETTTPAPRQGTQNNGETRERIVEDVPPDKAVSNNPRDERREQRRQQQLQKQARRNGQIIEMSEEEWRDYQRRQRNRRQNRGGFPY